MTMIAPKLKPIAKFYCTFALAPPENIFAPQYVLQLCPAAKTCLSQIKLNDNIIILSH